MQLPDLKQIEEQFPGQLEIQALTDKIDYLGRRIGAPNTTYIEFAAVTNITTGVLLLSENFNRRSLVIFQNSGFPIYVHTRQLNGNNATAWMIIPSGQFWEPLVVPTNALYAIGTNGAQVVFGYEGV